MSPSKCEGKKEAIVQSEDSQEGKGWKEREREGGEAGTHQ